MTSQRPDFRELLDALRGTPAAEREARLRAAGEPGDCLAGLAEEVERLAVSEIAQALPAGELLVELADRHGGCGERARARRARAQALAYAGRFEEALPLYREAATLALHAGQAVEAARAEMSSVHALASLARYGEAIAAGSAALEAFEAAGEHALAARAHSNLGAAHQNRGDPAAALRHFDQARDFLADVPVARAQVDSNRGRALLALDDFAGAEQAYRAALPEFEQAEMGWAAAIVEGNLAELYTRQGRLERALHYFERARRHLERDEAPADLARLRAERADALAVLGLPGDALAEFEATVPELREHGFALEAVRALAGRGLALVRIGRLAEAEPVLAEAADGYEELGHTAAQARVDLARAELATARGDFQHALSLAADALRVLHNRPAEAAAAQYQLAYAAWRAGDEGRALAELDRVLPRAERLGIAPLLADLRHLRGRIQHVAGRPVEAAAELRAALDHVERVRGALQAERFRAAFQGGRLALYDDLIRALLDGGGPAAVREAFHVAERARSRALLDLVAGALDPAALESACRDPAEQAVLVELGQQRAALSALYSRLADAELEAAGAGDPERYRREIAGREQRLDELESRLAATSGVGGLYAPAATAEQVLAFAPAEMAVIEYHAAGDELLAFVLRGGQVQVFRRLADAAALVEDVERLHFQLRRALRPGAVEGPRGTRLIEDARRELRGLHGKLIYPLGLALTGADRLLIVPHGVLHTVPFHALWDGAQYLMEQAEVSYAPSASLPAQRRGARTRAATAAALVAGAADERAPGVTEEAQRVAAALGHATLLVGEAATADAFVAAAREAELVHFAGHGFFSSEHPLGSGLRLADRWLTARELYGLRLGARLVTLSGCETGRHAVRAADELVGLGRGFFVAGAGGLLVSLWKVSDRSTADLMVAFYNQWRRTGGEERAAAALRAAQRAALQATPHPAFWAPFVLTGEA